MREVTPGCSDLLGLSLRGKRERERERMGVCMCGAGEKRLSLGATVFV